MVYRFLFFVLFATLFITSQSIATDARPNMDEPSVVGESHRRRYPLATASQKLVNDRGDGYENLYGVKNFRAVLNGVYYRGGANNSHHRTNTRDNRNPLPNDGLQNLCKEGFSRVIYLYDRNYGEAPHEFKCRDFEGNENQLQYLQISPSKRDERFLLSMIHEHIRDQKRGPIYDHCWNGWHASGYVAALALRQFCGFTADQAIDYWNLTTDGANKDPHYRKDLRAFRPKEDLSISAEEKEALCPAPVEQFSFRIQSR